MSNTLDNNPPDARLGDSLKIEIIVDDEVSCRLEESCALEDSRWFDESRLRQACLQSAASRGFDRGEIGIRVTNDPGIHAINRDHLGHDYPTDVISFSYRDEPPTIEGELVVSVDTARERAMALGWSTQSELMLYVVHGTLHITGMNDINDSDRAEMRTSEQQIMLQLGIDEIVRLGADCVDDTDADPALDSVARPVSRPVTGEGES